MKMISRHIIVHWEYLLLSDIALCCFSKLELIGIIHYLCSTEA